MSKIDHQIVGVSVAVLMFLFLESLGYGNYIRFGAGFLAFWGGTAPDWLEIAHAERDYNGKWQRVSLIPHRTFTHWLPLWIIPTLVLLWILPRGAAILRHPNHADVLALLLAFLAGGISHLLCDLPNPTGIPVLLPGAKHRISLRLWRSGSGFEWIEIALFWGVTFLVWAYLPGAVR
ncbi:metal-dependent hydrolase [Acidithiobacillus caldus]|nr:metal-dependent hydrolase [Acidithiobacillus caldus]